jgi:Receptor family ligand binding region
VIHTLQPTENAFAWTATTTAESLLSQFVTQATAKNSSGANDEGEGGAWPVKREAVVEGDVILGGLMMVHEREDSVTCGPIMPQGGIQALEAMLYTVDRVNEDKNFLPAFTLGAYVLDDCDKDTYGLEMAVDFIKGKCAAFSFERVRLT